MKVYLAGRYRRLDEIRRCADDLRESGHQVTSRWVLERHTAPGPLDHPSWAALAQNDVDDTLAADAVISFTEAERGGGGGRQVEFGMGLALGKRLILVGPREHLFHTLPGVEVYATWGEALDGLSRRP